MKKLHNALVASLALVALSGCGAMPHHASIRTVLTSQLVFKGGPEGAAVLIDGAQVGQIARKETRIPVPDGTHVVSVRSAGASIYDQTVFIVDGTQKIIPLGN